MQQFLKYYFSSLNVIKSINFPSHESKISFITPLWNIKKQMVNSDPWLRPSSFLAHINRGLRSSKLDLIAVNMSLKHIKWKYTEFQTLTNWTYTLNKVILIDTKWKKWWHVSELIWMRFSGFFSSNLWTFRNTTIYQLLLVFIMVFF